MQLAATKRDIAKSPKILRESGVLPAVIYGRSEASTPIAVNLKDFKKVFSAAGESTVIEIAGLGEDKDALIHEVALHPVSGEPVHVDFYAIEKGQTVTVSVPLVFEGVSAAVKDLGGILVKVMHELEVEVLPKELPHQIVVDISKLETLESQIKVSDLALPASAKLSVGTDEVVAMVTVAKEEVEEAAPVDITQIGMSVEKGKKEEEGTDAAAAPAAA